MKMKALSIVFVILSFTLSISAVAAENLVENEELITDSNGFQYFQSPFTIRGLTFGKPINRIKEIEYLFPGKEKESTKKVHDYLNKHKLVANDIPTHQYMIFGFEPHITDLSNLGRKYVSIYTDDLTNALGLGRLSDAVRVEWSTCGATPVGLLISSEDKSQSVAKDLDSQKLIKILGRPGLRLRVDDNIILIWKHMEAVTSGGRVTSFGIGAHQPMAVGPKPAKKDDFSIGWLLSWRQLMKVAKYPGIYQELMRDLEHNGAAWSEDQMLLIQLFIAYNEKYSKKGILELKYGNPEGVICGDGKDFLDCWGEILATVFPKIIFKPEDFDGALISIRSDQPGMVNFLSLDWGWKLRDVYPSINLIQFEKIFGKSNLIETMESKGKKMIAAYYPKRKVIAIFEEGKLIGFSMHAFPLVFPKFFTFNH